MRRESIITVMAMSLLLVLTAALAGCGAQAVPDDSASGAQPKHAVQESGAAVISSGITWDKATEPPPHKIGGIPAADLTAEPKYGGTLIHGHSGWTRLDPFFPSGPWGERWPVRLYANGLLEWDLKCNCPKPELAESWNQVDDLTFDFKIRKGIKFHNVPPVNGRELTIQDVKWSLDYVSGLGERPAGKISINYERFESVKEFKILDDSTLRLVLKRTDSMILRELMHEYSMILPKEAMIDGGFNNTKALIGTGPFIVELAQNTGQSRFKRNPDYWKKDSKGRQLPYLNAVYTLGNSDQAATQAAMKTEQAHWVLLAYRYGKVFENNPQYRIYNTTNSGVGTSGFWMNTTVKPFNDVRVRRAINLAIDREELGLAVYGPGGYYNWTFLGTWEPYTWSQEKLASMPGYATGAAKQKEYDEAKLLLAEAGYANGFEFTCECENVEKAEVLVEQMKRIGLKVNVKKVSSTDMRWTTYMKDKQFANAYMGGGHTPDYAIQQYFLCNSPKNLALVCDPKIESWYKEFRSTFDEKKQADILRQVQDYLWELMPVANDHRAVTYFISHTWVRGWRNPMYDCCWAHGDQVQYTWLDR